MGSHSSVEARLRAQQEVSRRIIEAMPGGIVHIAANGSVLTANREALCFLGLSYDEMTRRYVSDWETETLWEDGTPCLEEDYPVTRALVSGQAQPPVTVGLRRPDGKISWAIFTAVPILDPETSEPDGAVVTFLDVTARKQAEEGLRASEAKLRSVVRSAPTHIVMADAEGEISFVNRTALGQPPAKLVGSSIYGLVCSEDRARLRERVGRVLQLGTTEKLKVTCPTPEGDASYRMRLGRLDSAGGPPGLTLAFWDITEQQAMEARLMLSDRMASVGALAAGVAHEINNPLTYVLANLDWIQRDFGSLSPMLEKRVSSALEGAERIRDIVSDLSMFTQVTNQELALDVHDVLDSALRMAHSALRHRARLEEDRAELPPVSGDRSRLGQVFLNLLVNAAQAIPEGQCEGNFIRVRTQMLSDDWVRVSISDTGRGIDPALVGRIFDPFVTTKQAPGAGSGLGLYIAHSVVDAMGGNISVQSALGEGTTFHVDLPRARPGARHGSKESAQGTTSWVRSLIVGSESGANTTTKRAGGEGNRGE